eukprot:GHRQ01038190.1.p1 GENE.GHRQ01038190.1~~GHRQ01038190.1.p1  ORF type:complete len:155 (+),score=14.66 GHRQ01038190.1:470-934(+)
MSNASYPAWVFDARAANMTKIVGIGLGGTQLQLPSWTVIKETLRSNNWTSFQRLSLPSSSLTGPIGPLAYYMPQLTTLDLSNNKLAGVLPPDLSAAYSNLLYVNLSSNNLHGKRPKCPRMARAAQVLGYQGCTAAGSAAAMRSLACPLLLWASD